MSVLALVALIISVGLCVCDAPFIADTSTWWRFASLQRLLAELVKRAIDEDRLWITPIVRMEIPYSARTTSEYAAVEGVPNLA